MTPTTSERLVECRKCGDEVPADEIKLNDGLCDECDLEVHLDDQGWGAHEDEH